MPAFSLVIFDFDGTLADTFPWFCSVLNETAGKFGFKTVEESEVEKLRSLSSREIVAQLGVPMWKIPAIAMHMRRLAGQQPAFPLFPNAAEALSDLHHLGMKIAVVSSNGEATVRRTLGSAVSLVDCFECGTSLWGKTAKFKAVASRLGIDPPHVISIGDEIRDIEAARNADMACGAVTFGYNSSAALAQQMPDLLIHDFADLKNQLAIG